MHIVIRAGGSGTRLWPLSRSAKPKQFLSITEDRPMIASTFARVAPMVGAENIFVSVNKALVATLNEALPELLPGHSIIEPVGRNTGPAMCLEICFLLDRLDPKTIVASLPSDDYISDEAAFRNLLAASEQCIERHPEYIVTPAIKPEYPEVGYSYLRAGEILESSGQEVMYAVTDIAEKPNRERCEELIESGIYYWHTGMYIWQLGRAAELFKLHQSAMFDTCQRIVSLMKAGADSAEIEELYASLEKISVESALTDRVDSLAMSVSNHVGWSDVGKWSAVQRILGERAESDMTVAQDSQGNLVIGTDPKKLIVLNHASNLAVIDTPDVLLISDLDSTEDIRDIIERLKKEGKENYT